jgi:hypothetical protein
LIKLRAAQTRKKLAEEKEKKKKKKFQKVDGGTAAIFMSKVREKSCGDGRTNHTCQVVNKNHGS